MRIIRTSQQYREQKKKRQAAFAEMQVCPECKHEREMANNIRVVETLCAMAYRATCKNCGCIWESSEF